jgi:hypothetical protein
MCIKSWSGEYLGFERLGIRVQGLAGDCRDDGQTYSSMRIKNLCGG